MFWVRTMTWNKKPWAAKVYEFVNIDGRFVVGRGRQRAAQIKICLLKAFERFEIF